MNTRLEINVYITQENSGGRIGFNETLNFGNMSFTQISEVLKKFHELAETLKPQVRK